MNLQELKSKLSQLTKKNLFKDTSWMLIARLVNVVVQAAYFIIVARALGAENYGSFVGVTSLASLLFPFIALGTDSVLVKEVSVNRQAFASHWGNTLLILGCNSAFFVTVLLLISRWIFPDNISVFTISALLLADLLLLGLFEATTKVFRAVDLVKKTAQLVVLSTVGKLLAALCLITLFKPGGDSSHFSVTTWSILYFLSSLAIGLLALGTVTRMVGMPSLNLKRIKSDINQGIYFSIGMSASNINNNIDKTMLASMATLEATGIYGSAYRFINIGNVPLNALSAACYARFFQEGAKGIRNCFKFAKKLLPLILGYCIISILGYQVLAPLIPKVLGAEYANAVSTLRWLAPVPAITCLQWLAADTLTGSGHQKIRSLVQVTAAILNVILNLWLIPLYGLRGAIWATLTSDTFRMIVLWLILFFLHDLAERSSDETLEQTSES